jgi:hypothetical protein
MKFRTLALSFAAAFGAAAGAANATTFVFKGDGNNVTPLGSEGADYVRDCGTVGADYCSADPDAGLEYTLDGIGLTVRALAEGASTRLIQDVSPGDSGLGAYSENTAEDDQTQFDAAEAIEFSFDRFVSLTDVEFNAGGDRNCSIFGPEGPCGMFNLTIDGVFIGAIAAVDNIAFLGAGLTFLLEAITEGAGFTIAQFTASDVSDVPVPAAFPLLAAGLAGLGFAYRRKRDVIAIR